MIVGSKLPSSFLMSAIYSFLKYQRYRQTSSGNVENLQLWFGSPLRDLFFDPLSFDSALGFDSKHWAESTNQPFC